MKWALPFEHFLPGKLIVGIVDVDDVVHVTLAELVLMPAPTCLVNQALKTNN